MPHYTSEVLMKKGTAYRLSGPGPALMLDLEAWQKYFGFDPNSAYASMTVGVDLDALVLTGLFSGEIPQVKTMPLFNRDIKGEVAEGGRRPGPFLQLPKTSTQISIDPRQRKQ
jgi:hypothetical protein